MSRRRRGWCLAAVVPGLSSCAADLDFGLLRDHVVLANEDGRMVDLETKRPLALDIARTTIDRILDRAVRACQEHDAQCSDLPPHSLLVHVHGGMNSYDDSLARAQRIIARMAAEKGEDWHYPVFLVWPTAPIDCYHDHVWNLRYGHREWWGPPTSPFVFLADLGSGIARSVYSLPRQLIMDGVNAVEIASGTPKSPESKGVEAIYGAIQADAQLGRVDAARAEERLTGVKVGKGAFSRGFWRQTGRAATWILLQPFKLVTSALICDGLGNGAWEVMLRRTYNLYRPASTLDAAEMYRRPDDLKETLQRPPAGAAALLFQQIRDHFARNGHTRITLVGHSMGAIVLNLALSILTDHGGADPPATAGTSPVHIDDIVYMAPACSIAEAEQMLIPFLQHNRDTEFHLLTLHPFAEFSERHAFDLVPRGSLLAWIESWYATAGGHIERRLGIWDSALQALPIFRGVDRRVEIKAFGVQGDSMPQEHGQFNDCPFWRRSFWSADVRDVYAPEWWEVEARGPGSTP